MACARSVQIFSAGSLTNSHSTALLTNSQTINSRTFYPSDTPLCSCRRLAVGFLLYNVCRLVPADYPAHKLLRLGKLPLAARFCCSTRRNEDSLVVLSGSTRQYCGELSLHLTCPQHSFSQGCGSFVQEVNVCVAHRRAMPAVFALLQVFQVHPRPSFRNLICIGIGLRQNSMSTTYNRACIFAR